MSDLIKLLPSYERNSVVLREILTTEEGMLEERNLTIDDLEKQFSISTATWALDIYENALNIKTDLSKSYEERRSVIKSKRRGTGKVDRDLIKIVVDSFTNGNIDVSFDGSILVIFNDINGIPPSIEDVYESIESIKPAHLQVLYRFKYLVISEMNRISINNLNTMTINDFSDYQ